MKRRIPYRILAVAVLLLVSASFASAQNGALNVVKPAIADRDLVITVSDVTENEVFYPEDIGGTLIEVLAVRSRQFRSSSYWRRDDWHRFYNYCSLLIPLSP
jgi:hypothetical protein